MKITKMVGVTEQDANKVRRLACNNWENISVAVVKGDARDSVRYTPYDCLEIIYTVNGGWRRSVISRQTDRQVNN